MSRKQLKRRTGGMAKIAIVGFFVLAVACGVGFGVASADSSDDIAQAGSFGFDEATHAATSTAQLTIAEPTIANPDNATAEQSALTQASTRDLTAGFQMIEDREEQARRLAAEKHAKTVKLVESNKARQDIASALDDNGAPATQDATEYQLAAVDWSVDEETFVAEWTARIDAYLQGSNLQGYGNVFAQAAWDNGVDPRWSPSISNTESTKGKVCFLPHNAWGWGASAWADWPSAICEHVAGLAEVYGYSLTPDAAQTYCPPNAAHWYEVTLAQMSSI